MRLCGHGALRATRIHQSAPSPLRRVTATTIIEEFKNTATAPIKAPADIQPRDVDLVIDIVDVTRSLDAFSGLPYPFTPSTTSPCPLCGTRSLGS